MRFCNPPRVLFASSALRGAQSFSNKELYKRKKIAWRASVACFVVALPWIFTSQQANADGNHEGIAYPSDPTHAPDLGKPLSALRMTSGPERELINQVKKKFENQQNSSEIKNLLTGAIGKSGKEQMVHKFQWGASLDDWFEVTKEDAFELAGDGHLQRFLDCLSFKIIGICYDIQLWPPWDVHFHWSLVKTYRWPVQSMEVVKDRGVSAYVVRGVPAPLIAIPKKGSPISFVPMTLKTGVKLGDDVLRSDSKSSVSKLLKVGSFSQLLKSDLRLGFAAVGPDSLTKSIPGAIGVSVGSLPGLRRTKLPSAGTRRAMAFAKPENKTLNDYEFLDGDSRKITDVINYDKTIKNSSGEKQFDEIEERIKNPSNGPQAGMTTEYRVHPSYAGEAVQKLWNKTVAPVIQAAVDTAQEAVIGTICSLFGPAAAACEIVAPRAVSTGNLCHKTKTPPHYFSELPNGILQSRFVTANLLVPGLADKTLEKIINPLGCTFAATKGGSGGESMTDAFVNMFEKLDTKGLGIEAGVNGGCLSGNLNTIYPILNTTLQAEYSSGSEVAVLKAIKGARAWGDIVDPPSNFWGFSVDHNPYYDFDTQPEFDTLQWTHDEEMPKDCLDQLDDRNTGTKWNTIGNSWRRYYFENDENKSNNYDIHKLEFSKGTWDDYWNVAYLWRRIICCPFGDRVCLDVFPFSAAPHGQCDDTSDSIYQGAYQDNIS